MRIIRKRLDEQQLYPSNTRWNDDCECVQSTFDGGTTWVNTPNADPRHNVGGLAPANAETDPRCSAAAGMRTKIEQILNAVFTASSIIDMANAIFALITVTLPGVGLLVRVILLVCEALVAIGIAALQIEFTEEAFDQLQCIFYDNLDSDGQMSAAQLAATNTQICEEMSVTVCAAMGLLLNMLGEVGMSNAGALFGEDGDCSDCGWTRCWLGGDGLGDWVTPWVTPIDPRSAGVYNAGTDAIDGTEINETSVWANFALNEALDINGLVIDFDYDNPSPYGEQGFIWFVNGEQYQDGLMPSGTGSSSYSWEGDGSGITQLGFLFASGGSVSITRIKLAGTGTPPVTGADCE